MNKPNLLYLQTKNMILDDISNMDTGDALASRNELAKKYNVSRVTLEHSLAELIQEGYLVSRKGSGTFVVKNEPSVNYPAINYQNNDTWALLISNILYDIYPYILRGVEDVANKQNKSLMICNTDGRGDKQEEYLKKLLANGIGGIIIVPAPQTITSYEIFREIEQRDMPIVSCIRNVSGFNFPGILFNSFEAGLMATQHLIDCGCRHIGYLAQAMYASSMDRYQGYLAALKLNGIPYNADYVFFEEIFDLDNTGYEITKSLFAKNDKIDGFFAFNDRVAVGACQAVEELGYKIGSDIKIVSCDNTDICERLPVKLTSVGYPLYEIGRKAGEYLYERTTGTPPTELNHLFFDCQLFVRDSTKGN